MAGFGDGLRFADDFFDSHEAREVGAFQFVHAHDDVSDGFFDGGDEDVFERVDSPSCVKPPSEMAKVPPETPVILRESGPLGPLSAILFQITPERPCQI